MIDGCLGDEPTLVDDSWLGIIKHTQTPQQTSGRKADTGGHTG